MMDIKETTTIKACQRVFDRHSEEKGESWKTCDIQFLRNKLAEELDEFAESNFEEQQYNELLDVINIAVMLAERLKERLALREKDVLYRKNKKLESDKMKVLYTPSAMVGEQKCSPPRFSKKNESQKTKGDE